MDFIIETLDGQKIEKILTRIVQPKAVVKIPEGYSLPTEVETYQ